MTPYIYIQENGRKARYLLGESLTGRSWVEGLVVAHPSAVGIQVKHYSSSEHMIRPVTHAHQIEEV